jgi:hypothetical protein
VHVRQGLECGILGRENLRAGLEGPGLGWLPPVAQRSIGVDLASLVVEAVCQLVAELMLPAALLGVTEQVLGRRAWARAAPDT